MLTVETLQGTQPPRSGRRHRSVNLVGPAHRPSELPPPNHLLTNARQGFDPATIPQAEKHGSWPTTGRPIKCPNFKDRFTSSTDATTTQPLGKRVFRPSVASWQTASGGRCLTRLQLSQVVCPATLLPQHLSREGLDRENKDKPTIGTLSPARAGQPTLHALEPESIFINL